ncbi:transposase [Salegentibacter holothuriorum]|uniref:transposase n=1 Tax=Salegentibacter holothuriorum TaxID=241145 RepID=UPI0009A85E55
MPVSCFYIGITPSIRKSGKGLRGKSRISKASNPKLWNLLFWCSFTACKEIYERIIAKGKAGNWP